MARLTAMAPAEYEVFRAEVPAAYAEDNVASGRWPREGALERAHRDFERLLPQGSDTPGHFLYEIRAEPADVIVGHLWFAVQGAGQEGYLYNIRIKPAFRGRGHARAALQRLEDIALAQGVTTIALHVFVTNASAQALYRSLGYGNTGFNMLKPLNRP